LINILMTTGAEPISTRFGPILAVVNSSSTSFRSTRRHFHVDQVLNILQVSAFLGVVATGQTLALLVGGIDVSVAGVVTMSNIVSTSVMVGRSETMLTGIAVCLLIAALVGLINGWMIPPPCAACWLPRWR
jgi:ribose/xylose/arabinose/galactoside ABC-type transport system permease subunit